MKAEREKEEAQLSPVLAACLMTLKISHSLSKAASAFWGHWS